MGCESDGMGWEIKGRCCLPRPEICEISRLIFPFFFTGGNREYRGKCAISLSVPSVSSCSN